MNIDTVRSRFPALNASQAIYADNAGGTQVLDSVIDHVSEYYRSTNAQLGGLYPVSKSSADAVQAGLVAGASFIHADPSEVVFGSSTTQLFTNLSLVLDLSAGDELIVSEMDHEANIAPWHRIAAIRGCRVIPWKVRRDTEALHLDDLRGLLSDQTRLVTVTHSSNMLGTINPVKEIAALVHAHSSARVVVDGVAFAPHRLIDVQDLGVDFYCFSWYKVYGPHIAMLYASNAAQSSLGTLKHYFHDGDDLSTRLGLAGNAYELQSSIPEVVGYLSTVDPAGSRDQRTSLQSSFDSIAQHEEALQTIILNHLLSRPDTFRVWGSKSVSRHDRMPLISFTVTGVKSSDVVARILANSQFGIRNGHMYSKRLMDHLGCDPAEYAIRISLCHYNSLEEAQDFVAILKQVI
ncbi:putative Aminotransferase [Taphrina deformans PYCC 5710]|uniref:Aminotransferase n=1 Tax=Taphrina deformans (strain PYCC 5710 / ATCC 11124 / CBS 356.35 / IMI 108563 / JCM 9778 / NBRC 8474) TaxID=1097556 RepID=R4XB29_TAPDE|nr:putative Aminotransferase [Taphrina deformans PYCC 5710]|eukprot:CCG81533.1 putative Aminotransferase [Taphrina deformans PYCC 5710]